MAAKTSSGILLFRTRPGIDTEVLLGHMGGPFWAARDTAAWSIPKGEHTTDEEPMDAARREFEEELGLPVPHGPLLPLGELGQAGGKRVTVWALRGDLDPAQMVPTMFSMEWPPRSGRFQEFPEIDRAAWFRLNEARDKLVTGQRPFLDILLHHVLGRLRD